jgi:hypothetical protein
LVDIAETAKTWFARLISGARRFLIGRVSPPVKNPI